MKKFLKAAAGVLLAVCLVTGIAGCSEFDLAGEGTAYGVVGSYVGFITVRTDAEGKVTNVIIDEMQTPEHWAEISAFDEADDGDFFAATKPDAKRWAKKIVIGGKVFEAIGTAEGVNPDYRLAEYNNGVGLLEWLRSGLNAKWYVEQMKLGNYGVSKAAGGVNNEYKNPNELSLGDRWLKSKNGYWAPGYGLGWKANIEAIQNYLMQNGFADKGIAVRGEDKVWTINGTATGATINACNEYINLAQIAYGIATTQVSE